MQSSFDLAARLLRFEQQLQAHRKLHSEELAELWQTLNECKRELTAALPDERVNSPIPVKLASEECEPQEEKDNET